MDDATDTIAGADPDNIGAMLDPALFEQDVIPSDDVIQLDLPNGVVDTSLPTQHEDQSVAIAISLGEDDTVARQRSLAADLAETTSTTVVKQEPDAATTLSQPQAATTNSDSTIAGHETIFEVDSNAAVQSRTPGISTSPVQRHSSRQPKQVQRYVPDAHPSPTKAQSQLARGERRGSSAASGHTRVDSVKSRRSSSNTSGTTHQIAVAMKLASSPAEAAAARPDSRGSTAESELDPDVMLARELQAEEHGLRRRQSMRL